MKSHLWQPTVSNFSGEIICLPTPVGCQSGPVGPRFNAHHLLRGNYLVYV